jgi:hypothetical protein
MFNFEMLELWVFNSMGSHSDDFLDECLNKGNGYVFRDDKGALVFSEDFSDLLDLA